MADDDYELMPHQVLADLKYEVEALKKKLVEPDAKAQELILEMESLKDSLQELTTVFHKALEETKGEEDLGKQLKSSTEKLAMVISQNETIARGMVAISDKLDDFMRKQSSAPSMMPTARHTMGMPPGMSGPRVAPPPMPSLGSPFMPPGELESNPPHLDDLPPPPPAPGGREKKKLISGLFR